MASLSQLMLLLGAVSGATATCAHGTSLYRRAEAKFGYLGTQGPWNWASLNAENALCSTGTRQSPIDLQPDVTTTIASSEVTLNLPDMAAGAEFINLGTTVEVNTTAAGGSVTFRNVTYSYKQFHFHLPSEHLDTGGSMPMEMHNVFQAADKSIAVVSALIDVEGQQFTLKARGPEKRTTPCKPAAAATRASSTLLEGVFSNLDKITEADTSTELEGPLVMSELVRFLGQGNFRTYSGSLTTPPCTEGVTWLVSTQTLLIKSSTLGRVRDVIGFNSRMPQNTPGQTNILQLSAAPAAAAPAAE